MLVWGREGTRGLASCLIKQDSPETRALVSGTDKETHLQQRTTGLVHSARTRVLQSIHRQSLPLVPGSAGGMTPVMLRMATHQLLPKLACSRKVGRSGLKDVSN